MSVPCPSVASNPNHLPPATTLSGRSECTALEGPQAFLSHDSHAYCIVGNRRLEGLIVRSDETAIIGSYSDNHDTATVIVAESEMQGLETPHFK